MQGKWWFAAVVRECACQCSRQFIPTLPRKYRRCGTINEMKELVLEWPIGEMKRQMSLGSRLSVATKGQRNQELRAQMRVLLMIRLKLRGDRHTNVKG
jgi:hypothetical protein